jgi:hypothetical protein
MLGVCLLSFGNYLTQPTLIFYCRQYRLVPCLFKLSFVLTSGETTAFERVHAAVVIASSTAIHRRTAVTPPAVAVSRPPLSNEVAKSPVTVLHHPDEVSVIKVRTKGVFEVEIEIEMTVRDRLKTTIEAVTAG